LVINQKDKVEFVKERQQEISRPSKKVDGPAVGQDAPDFALKALHGEKTVKLSSFRGKKPVVLIFGSYTWPPFRAQSEILERQYKQYKDRSEWFIVYIRESHPAGKWEFVANVEAGISVNQPNTIEERAAVANTCVLILDLSIPAIIDDMDDTVRAAYRGMPDRLYIVDKEGKIAYRGGKGPYGFKPLEMEKALKRLLAWRTEPALKNNNIDLPIAVG
jgi:peroxiredoxin